MGYKITKKDMNEILAVLSQEHSIYAPKLFFGEGSFSDTDSIRYGEIQTVEEIVFDKKSDYSFKEILLPLSQTILYFTDEDVKEPDAPKKGAIVFLRSCELHALRRLDDIYLRNGYEDYYYKRFRERTKFILLGCANSFQNCFCVSMGTNQTDEFDAFIKLSDSMIEVDNKTVEWDNLFQAKSQETLEVKPEFVTKNPVIVHIPENLNIKVINVNMWKEYNERCTACGRCNFVCPTCTCFTMQDIFYTDNGKVGERRRVWASCQIEGFTDMAGGHSYRKDQGQRMRFKVLHKVYDYQKRNGVHMCVGCGRCDDICREYISFSQCINRLEDAMKEVEKI